MMVAFMQAREIDRSLEKCPIKDYHQKCITDINNGLISVNNDDDNDKWTIM